MDHIGIYALLDPTTNELRYIGLSKRINIRYKEHCKNTITKKGTHLFHWLKKLLNNNKFPILKILEECSIEKLAQQEKYWIKFYKDLGCNLVNHSDGGESFDGFKCSEETKEKISKTLTGRKNPPMSDIQKKKLSIIRKGMKFTEEHRKNISLAQIGKKVPNKKGIQIQDSLGNTFISISKASEFHKLKIYTIWRLLRGAKSKTIKITFKYI